jgi:hypothetical protein
VQSGIGAQVHKIRRVEKTKRHMALPGNQDAICPSLEIRWQNLDSKKRAVARTKCVGSPHLRVRQETAVTRGLLMQELAELL